MFALVSGDDPVRWDAGMVPDQDGDGYTLATEDCNEANPTVHPGAVEACDGDDDNCDGRVDEGCDTSCDLPSKSGGDVDLGATNAAAPRLAWTGSSYGMVFTDLRDGNAEIYFAGLDASFSKFTPDVRVSHSAAPSSAVQIAWTGTYFGIVWQDSRDGNEEIYFSLLSVYGDNLSGEVRVTNAAGTSRFPRIAWTGTDFGVLWNDQRDGTFENYFVRLSAYGQPRAPERRITPLLHDSNSGQLTWNGSVFGIVYPDIRDGDWEIYFQTLDRSGEPVTPETRLTSFAGYSRYPILAWDGAAAQFGVAWVDNPTGSDQIFFTRVALDGTKRTGDHALVGVQGASNPIVSMVHSGSEFALSWHDATVGSAGVYFARLAGDAFADPPIRVSALPAVGSGPSLNWTGSDYAIAFDNYAALGSYHAFASRIGCCTVSTIGDRVWRDADVDGIQDAGETGVTGTLVAVYDGTGALLGASSSGPDGAYQLTGLSCGSTYELRFFPPGNDYLSPQHQGTDDALDSDPDPATGSTGTFVLTSSADAARWDAGIAACWPPDEPVYIASVGRTTDGNNYPILNFQDPNQPEQITGYNVYRSDTPGAAWPWPLVATDVVDMDAATPNLQWVDASGDVSPTGAWYYQVTAYNHRCPAEGPR